MNSQQKFELSLALNKEPRTEMVNGLENFVEHVTVMGRNTKDNVGVSKQVLLSQNNDNTNKQSNNNDEISSQRTSVLLKSHLRVSTFKVGSKRMKYKVKIEPYAYNTYDHKMRVRIDNLSIDFVYPAYVWRPYDIEEPRSFSKRQTQGLVYLSMIADAVSTVGGAASMYYIYKSLSSLFSARSDDNIVSYLKNHIIDILYVATLLYKLAYGRVTLGEALILLTSHAYVSKLNSKLVSNIKDFFKSFGSDEPAHSRQRLTQGESATHVSFVHGVLSLIGAFIFGGKMNFDTQGLLGSIKTLGSTILTVKTLEGVLCNIINNFPEIVLWYLGQYFPQVYLYTLSYCDETFKKFLDETSQLMALNELDIFYNSHNLSTFLRLHDHFLSNLLTTPMIKKGFAFVAQDMIHWFDKIYNQANNLGLLPGKRKHPFVIWLSGDPGVGKSTYARKLARDIVKHTFGEIPEHGYTRHIYTYNTANPYMDDYHNQHVFVINDYLQFLEQHEEQHLIRFADTLDVHLNPSSVDNPRTGIKGEVRFTSRVIIITSNVNHVQSSREIVSPEALNRRRNLVIAMKWRDQHSRQIDFNNFDFSWAEISVLRNVVHMRQQEVPMYVEPDRLKDLIFQRMALFDQQQDQVLKQTGFTYDESIGLCQTCVLIQQNTQSFIKSYYEKLSNHVSNILDYDLVTLGESNTYSGLTGKIVSYIPFNNVGLPSFKVKHLLSICMVGSAGYFAYKSMASYLISHYVTQSMSGDVSTRKFTPERRPLNRHTMSNVSNTMDLAASISKNICRITVNLHGDNRVLSQTMYGLFCGGSLIITPSHLWRRGNLMYKESDTVSIEFKDVRYNIKLKPQDLCIDENKDLACINVLFHIPLVKSLDHLFLPEDSTISVNGEQGLLMLLNRSTMLIPVIAYIQDCPYEDGDGLLFEGKNIWQYNNTHTVRGDCGSPLLIKIKDKFYIGGLHVAGDNYSGNSEVLDTGVVNKFKSYFALKSTQGFATDVEYNDEEWFDAKSDFDTGFIFLGGTKQVYQNSKTEIVKSPLFEVLQPHVTEPAVLSPSDPRLEVVMSPMLKSISKYAEPEILPFNDKLIEKAFRIVSSFYAPISNETLLVCDFDETINAEFYPYIEKLDLNTSAGYPWNTKQITKKDLISKDPLGNLHIKQLLRDKLNTNENLLKKGTMFPYTMLATLKDERVSLEKVRIGKTRTFINFPVEYTILLRKYFDAFINAETKHAMEIGTTVGVNIYSTNWAKIFYDMKKYDYHLDGDFKAFDSTILPVFFRLYTKLVQSFYNDEFGRIRSLLVNGTCFGPLLVLGKVYMKMRGNPSGSRLTTSFNSFVNRMYVVMSILDSIPECYHTITFFNKHFRMFAHGDDHIIGFNSDIREYWDGLKLRDFMKKHNIDYTSSKKDQPLVAYTPLNKLFYLKSWFVFREGGIYCGLDKGTIQEMVSWQRDFSIVSTKMIVDTCLRYSYFWGEEYFRSIREKLLEAIKIQHLEFVLYDYEDLDLEYQYDGALTFKFSNC